MSNFRILALVGLSIHICSRSNETHSLTSIAGKISFCSFHTIKQLKKEKLALRYKKVKEALHPGLLLHDPAGKLIRYFFLVFQDL